LALGLASGLAGGFSTFAGGWLGDIAARGNPGRALLVPIFGFTLAAPFLGLALFAPNVATSVALLTLAYLTHFVYLGPVFASAQSLASPGMRAIASAIIIIGLSVIGASIGPYVAGVLSDALMPLVGKFSLRYALCIGCFTNVWAAVHLWIASRNLNADLMRD
jgi:hypothetical protein